MVKKSTQPVVNESVILDIPPMIGRPVKVTKLKDAKRLLSRLITQFQKGEVDSQHAKTLCYLAITFVQIARDVEMEERIVDLEQKIEEMSHDDRGERHVATSR